MGGGFQGFGDSPILGLASCPLPWFALAEVFLSWAKVSTLASGLGSLTLWVCFTVDCWEFGRQIFLYIGFLLYFVLGNKWKRSLFFFPLPPFAIFVRSVCLVLFVLD